jgi:hypothetical protein
MSLLSSLLQSIYGLYRILKCHQKNTSDIESRVWKYYSEGCVTTIHRHRSKAILIHRSRYPNFRRRATQTMGDWIYRLETLPLTHTSRGDVDLCLAYTALDRLISTPGLSQVHHQCNTENRDVYSTYRWRFVNGPRGC